MGAGQAVVLARTPSSSARRVAIPFVEAHSSARLRCIAMSIVYVPDDADELPATIKGTMSGFVKSKTSPGGTSPARP